MDGEPQSSGTPKQGRWVTFPFLIATMAGFTLAAGGWSNNIIVAMLADSYLWLVHSHFGFITCVHGTRFTLASMGADQFANPKHQQVYFTLYVVMLVSMAGIVYIQDNVSWGLGYGLSGAANLIGLAAFVLGSRHYLLLKPQGSLFTGLACVLVAAFLKRKALVTED